MNLFYNALHKAGVLRMDQVKREDGKWYPIDDVKKLMTKANEQFAFRIQNCTPQGVQYNEKVYSGTPTIPQIHWRLLAASLLPQEKASPA